MIRRNKQIESRIRRTAEHLCPMFPDQLLLAQKQEDIPMIHEHKIQKPRRRIAIAAIAACLVLLLAGTAGVFGYRFTHQINAVVGLDVNPSLELKISRQEKILEVDAVNEDAVALLDGMNLKGVPLDVAVNALIGSMYKNGYLQEAANSVLVSVEGTTAEQGESLQKKLAESIQQALAAQSLEGAVVTQTVAQDAELQQLADSYSISLGKAALIQQLIQGNPVLRFEELAGLSIHELNLLAESQSAVLDSVSTVGTVSDKAYIGQEKAEEVALSHAGVSRSNLTQIKSEMDYDDGRMVYEVDFLAGQVEYEYEIDAKTGEILHVDKESRETIPPASNSNPSNTVSTPLTGSETASDPAHGSSSQISRDQALQIALSNAGISAGELLYHKVETDRDDGILKYEVEMRTSSQKYEYEIDASNGKVLHVKSERLGTGATSSAASNVTGTISQEEALQIALAHAKLSRSDLSGLEIEQDLDDGISVFQIEFRHGSDEYEYEIQASNGQILEWDRDH